MTLVLGALAFAQEFRATISGRVVDSSGGAVPNAKIVATNTANNQTNEGVTSSTGAYTIPFLQPGTYKLTATATGFKSYNRENIILEVGKLVGIDISLEVGAITDSVNVSAEAALLETQTASRVGVVNTTQVSELPLNSRNPFMLGAMMSGVQFRGAAIWQRPFDNGAIAEWSVNGGRQSNNEFMMDGAPNNAQAGSNNIAYVPIVDAVQEFSVQQNSYDAQYGKTGGGVFNVVLKSGTPTFHITAWEFMRRKWMDANAYQNNAVKAVKPAHALDQYGFQLEGQVVMPKLLPKDGRVKLFYLGSFENYRELWPQFLNNSYPEMEMRGGDFSKLVTAGGAPIAIYDPFNTTKDANGDPIRTQFAGNVIPANRLNPVAVALSKLMPVPNAKTSGVRYATSNHQLPEYAAADKFYNLILKFDWTFGDKHRAFFRHASNDRTEDRATNGLDNALLTEGQQPFQRINDAYVLDWLSTISPTLVLNVRLANNRFIEKGFGRANEGFDLTSLGLPASLVNQLPEPRYAGRWRMDGYSNLGRYQSINITNNYSITTNVTKISGSHAMKFGIDLRRIQYIQQNTGDIFSIRTNAAWTQRLWNQGEATSGDSYASFLLGLPANNPNNPTDSSSVNVPLFPFNRQWYFAPYFQDDWKVSRKLSLNLGLRWDYNGPPDEKYDRMNRGFNPSVTSPINSLLSADARAISPSFATLKGGLEFVGANGNSRLAGKQVWTNWQPRVGAAYQVNDRLVARGGYGLYFLNPNNDSLRYAGYSVGTPLTNSSDEGRTPIAANILSNPFPGGILRPLGAAGGYNTFVGNNTNWYNPNMSTPYVHQFSFGFQYMLSQSSTLDVSYVGSRSMDLNSEKDFNIPSAAFMKQCDRLQGGNPNYCNEQVANPFKGLEPFRGTSFFTANTISRYQANRPYPQFSGNMLEQGRNDSRIWFNSMQVNFNQRMGRGLTLIANYTLSKMVEQWGYQDPFNSISQRGLYFNDRPHIVKFSTVYELPFGKGKMFGNSLGSFADKLVSGWQVSTYTNMASGEPNNLNGNVIQLKDPRTIGGKWKGSVDWKAHQVVGWNNCVLRLFNDGTTRPQQYSLDSGCGTDTANYAWLWVSDYTVGQGVPGRPTPSRSGQIRKQRLFNVDASISKMTQITERFKAQFRIEAFNLTNYYYFGRDSNFTTDPNDPNFGTLFPHLAWTGNGYPRQVQLGFKLFW